MERGIIIGIDWLVWCIKKILREKVSLERIVVKKKDAWRKVIFNYYIFSNVRIG